MAGKGSDNHGFMQAWYQQWERGLAAWWDRVLDTPEVLKGMNATLAGQVEARRAALQTGQRWMERMNLPTRQDLTRLVKIVTLVEERILGMEDRLLDLQDRLADAEKEAVKARIEAAEARIELAERLASLQARLASDAGATPMGDAAAQHGAPKAPARRARKAGRDD